METIVYLSSSPHLVPPPLAELFLQQWSEDFVIVIELEYVLALREGERRGGRLFRRHGHSDRQWQ